MNECKVIAQALTPMDTGNLRYNSYRVYGTPTGFRITSMFTVAPYGLILDISKKSKHYGWWHNKVFMSLSTYIKSAVDVRRSNFEQASRLVTEFAKTNDERMDRFYNSMIADEGRDAFLRRKV